MEKVVIQFDADFSQLEQSINKLKSGGMQELSSATNSVQSSMQKLSESAKNVPLDIVTQGVQEATESLKQNSQAITENVGKQQSMKAELKELKNKLQELEDQGKDNTKEFEKMAIRAGQLADQIGDTGMRIKALADDSKYIKAVSQAIGAMASAYSIAQGASALFGQENKEVEKALLKVNAAMAIANGIQQINEVLQKQSTLSVVANTAAQKLYTFAVGESTGALRVFRIALSATGIGAIVVGIIAAYEAMTAWNDKIKEAAESQKKLNEQMEKHRKDLEEVSSESERERNARKGGLDDMRRELDLLQAKGATESQIYKQKKKILEEELANLQILGYTFEGDNKKLQGILKDFNDKKAELRALDAEHQKNMTDKQREAERNNIEKSKKDAADATKAIIEGYQIRVNKAKQVLASTEKDSKEELEAKIALQYATNQLEIKQVQLSTDSEALKTSKIETLNAEMYAAIKQMMASYDKTQEDSANKEIEDAKKVTDEKVKEQKREQKEKDDAEKAAEDKKKAQKAKEAKDLEDQNKKRLDAAVAGAIQIAQSVADAQFEIEQRARDAKLQADLDAIEKRREAELNNANLTESQRNAITQKYAKLEADAKLKAWKADQQAKKEQAIINGALAITNIWATTEPVTAAILSAVVATTTALQVRTIASQPIPKFAKGKNVDDLYEGKALIGEAGRELRFDRDGSVKLYNRPTFDYVKKDTIIAPNALTEALLGANLPALNLNTMSAMSKNATITGTFNFDYDKLATSISNQMGKHQKVSINIDEKGFETRIIEGANQRISLNNRYKM